MILPLVLLAVADAFVAPLHIRQGTSRCATEAPELDDADLSALSTAATRMQLERRFSRSVTRRKRIYLPYADAARWARGLGLSSREDWEEWVGLGDKIDVQPPYMSGGEKQRVAVARAVISQPDLLLADEPTGNLDDAMAERLMHLFEQLNRQGTTLFIATHDTNLPQRFVHPVLRLDDGRLAAAAS